MVNLHPNQEIAETLKLIFSRATYKNFENFQGMICQPKNLSFYKEIDVGKNGFIGKHIHR